MLAERIRSLLRPSGESAPNGAGAVVPAFRSCSRSVNAVESAELDRQSNGLRQFFENLHGESRLSLLDLGGVSQANVNFITVRGHKLYTGDLLLSLEQSAPPAERTGRFVQENLNFAAEQFDGILVWDTLEFLDDEILAAVVSRMQVILKVGGTVLTFFHTKPKGEPVPVYRYQIRDHQTLRLQPRFSRPLPRTFNNRNLERLFGNFRSVKFFLAKDGLREVIVTR